MEFDCIGFLSLPVHLLCLDNLRSFKERICECRNTSNGCLDVLTNGYYCYMCIFSVILNDYICVCTMHRMTH